MMEFNVIRLPDGYVQASSIMPQKRNPVAIEHVRAIASKALGQTLGVLTSVHTTPFGDINDVEDDLQPANFAALRDATRSVSLLGHTLAAAEFNLDLLQERAEANFITVTELADQLVRQEQLPFSVAHKIVAECVRQASAEHGNITHAMLQSSANKIINRSIQMTESGLNSALSAENFVAVRTIHGGPAPAETRSALEEQRQLELSDKQWSENVQSMQVAAKSTLDDLISKETR